MPKGVAETTCGDHGGNKSDGEPCGRPEGWGTNFDTGKCKHHRGTRPDGGNKGGAAPEGNQNAREHGYYVDPDAFYLGCDKQKQQLIDDIEGSLIERYKEYHGREPDRGDKEDFYEVAIGYAKRRSMRDYQASQVTESGNPLLELREKDGTTFKVPSTVEELITNSRRENRLERKHKGLENDPEKEKAEATKTLADVLSE